MSAQIQVYEKTQVPAHFDDQVASAVKEMFPELTASEFILFGMVCQRTGLDPILKQIYAVKRMDNKIGRKVMTVQTGIDGFRMAAERTDCYAPGPEPTFAHDSNGNFISATAYVKKMTKDGTWHLVGATAYFDEYCQKYNGKPTGFWATMGKGQTAKCAEALAIRKAFPNRFAQLYSVDEMNQSQNVTVVEETKSKPALVEKKAPSLIGEYAYISKEQATELRAEIGEDLNYLEQFIDKMKSHKVNSLEEIPANWYARALNLAKANTESKQKKSM